MDNLKTAETCDKCGKPISILIADFERAMKDDLPVLCPGCEAALNEQAGDSPPYMAFKYKVISRTAETFDGLGAEGWELVAVDDGWAYFKKAFYREVT